MEPEQELLLADERRADNGLMVDPASFSARFRQRRYGLGLRVEDIADRLGLKQQSVTGWEHGSVPRPIRWVKVAAALETTVEWLFYGKGPQQPEKDMGNPPISLPIKREADRIMGSLDRVPVIPWALAGNWKEAQRAFHPGDAERWLFVTTKVGEMSFAVRVTGDSMASATDARSIPDGSLVVVDPGLPPQHNRIVLARRADHTLLRLYWVDGDQPMLRPLNDRYPTLDLPAGSSEIIGVAVQKIRELL